MTHAGKRVPDGGEGWPAVCVVGPLPPPSGGMANQCEQLVRLLRADGVSVQLVRTNPPYRPHWIGNVPVLRAGFRLIPYLLHLWQAIGRAAVVHVLANSGWAWHLFAAPAVLVARWRHTPVIINYRGGNADRFLADAPGHVGRLLAAASLRVTPSVFLQRVLAKYGLNAEVIPNIVDLTRFAPVPQRSFGGVPHLVVTRNLEAIYDIPTALRAFARIRAVFPDARMTVAGSGPELERLQVLAGELGLRDSVRFAGRIANAAMPEIYAAADCLLNPSTVDNMPISILEAFASGVPVVSTDAGGIPDLVQHGVSGLLVAVGDDRAMASEALRVLHSAELADALRRSGLEQAAHYAWPQIRARWLAAYSRVASARVAS